MSASTTRRILPGILIAVLAAAVLPGCGGPKPLDTGPSMIEAGREITETLWRKDLGRSLEHPPLWVAGSWLAAPTEGSLWRLDAETGTEIWKAKLPASPTSSPLVSGDVVVVSTDAPAGEVLGIRLETGKELWRWGRAITVPVLRDTSLVLAARGGRVVHLDPRNGEARWSVKQSGVGWRAPVFVEDLVVVPGRPDSLVAYRLSDGERVWGRAVGAWPAPAARGGILAAATDDSAVVVLEPRTGETRARIRLASMSAGAPLILDGRLVVAERSGRVVSLDADSLAAVWACPLESPLITAPFLHRERLLQAAPRGLILSIDPGTGEVLGVYRHPEPIVSSPRAAGSTLAVGGDYGTLVVYRGEP